MPRALLLLLTLAFPAFADVFDGVEKLNKTHLPRVREVVRSEDVASEDRRKIGEFFAANVGDADVRAFLLRLPYDCDDIDFGMDGMRAIGTLAPVDGAPDATLVDDLLRIIREQPKFREAAIWALLDLATNPKVTDIPRALTRLLRREGPVYEPLRWQAFSQLYLRGNLETEVVDQAIRYVKDAEANEDGEWSMEAQVSAVIVAARGRGGLKVATILTHAYLAWGIAETMTDGKRAFYQMAILQLAAQHAKVKTMLEGHADGHPLARGRRLARELVVKIPQTVCGPTLALMGAFQTYMKEVRGE